MTVATAICVAAILVLVTLELAPDGIFRDSTGRLRWWFIVALFVSLGTAAAVASRAYF
jgi:hypothetical protein